MRAIDLFAPLSEHASGEVIQPLLDGTTFRLERIVSTGQATPEGQWYDQTQDEWVLLLSGAARLRFENPDATLDLKPGDAIHIAAHRRHRVEWTDAHAPTVWLALHYTPHSGGARSAGGDAIA